MNYYNNSETNAYGIYGVMQEQQYSPSQYSPSQYSPSQYQPSQPQYSSLQYPNYSQLQPYQSDTTEYSSFSIVIMTAALFSSFIIIIWIIWAYKSYRYSDERISQKIMKKYNMGGGKKIDSTTEYVKAVNIVLNSDKTRVTCNIDVLNKETNELIRREKFSLSVKEACSPLLSTCITI
jgi:hypothetical protein